MICGIFSASGNIELQVKEDGQNSAELLVF